MVVQEGRERGGGRGREGEGEEVTAGQQRLKVCYTFARSEREGKEDVEEEKSKEKLGCDAETEGER